MSEDLRGPGGREESNEAKGVGEGGAAKGPEVCGGGRVTTDQGGEPEGLVDRPRWSKGLGGQW